MLAYVLQCYSLVLMEYYTEQWFTGTNQNQLLSSIVCSSCISFKVPVILVIRILCYFSAFSVVGLELKERDTTNLLLYPGVIDRCKWQCYDPISVVSHTGSCKHISTTHYQVFHIILVEYWQGDSRKLY